MTRGWPAKNDQRQPVMAVDTITSTKPMVSSVLFCSSAENVAAGPIDVKNMNRILARTLRFRVSWKSEK